jgi:hypothetical protein
LWAAACVALAGKDVRQMQQWTAGRKAAIAIARQYWPSRRRLAEKTIAPPACVSLLSVQPKMKSATKATTSWEEPMTFAAPVHERCRPCSREAFGSPSPSPDPR